MVKMTPMMQQYMDAKERYPEALLFFRMGDFYELFFEDAQVAARELGLTLTARQKGEKNEIPMAGVPHHASSGYVSQLIDRGFTVAICEQIEDPSAAKGIVKRDVVRVVTPGVPLDEENLDAKAPNYVAAVHLAKDDAVLGIGVAYLDVSTGDFRVTEVTSVEELASELNRVEPREVLIPEAHAELLEARAARFRGVFIRPRAAELFDPAKLLREVAGGPRLSKDIDNDAYFHDRKAISGLLDEVRGYDFRFPDGAVAAASAVLRYLVETSRGVPSHVRRAEPYQARSFLIIDDSTKANLELTETLMGGKRSGSLLSVIDRTATAMGGRLLRHWLNYPLVDPTAIGARLDAVDELVRKPAMRDDLREALGEVYDLERLCGRVSAGTANARDLRSLLSTLAAIPPIKWLLVDAESELLQALDAAMDPFEELRERIDSAIVDNPPATLTEGGLFKRGFDPELDEILEVAEHGKDWLLDYEAKEKKRTEIGSLKVRYNKVFGYYIEVTKANLDLVPDDYVRKQTLANAERYFTPELKEMEERILGAEEKRQSLEYRLFEALRREVGHDIPALLDTARQLAAVDVLAGFAELAVREQYSRPEIDDSGRLDIQEGRHPVVERTLEGERFVPNTVVLDTEEKFLQIVTGPNMAGKSTVIRQVALITLLAQMGSFVPAKSAKIGAVDRIFSRVGASDNLARGQSTFMVEMTETAHILNHATRKSLIILDEIGRGTSTFDGLSIAWAVAEHLHDHIGAKTMFATHYHELTELTRTLDGAENTSIAVKEWQDEIIFLRKLVAGEANRSYGVQVGRLAGLPEPVVARAKEVLQNLEQGQFDEMGLPVPGRQPGKPPRAAGNHNPDQLTLFTVGAKLDPTSQEVIERLREVDVNGLTPMQALNLVYELGERLKSGD